jgi:DNA mismatch endonuclease (patch repair protein)
MPDNLLPEHRLKTMRAVKGKGTSLERKLAAMLAGLGLKGWKKNPPGITGKPDIAFLEEKIVIFIDGCFWHGCPHCKRKLPQTNREYWVRKINRNVELGGIHNEKLSDEGWRVFRIWEHEIKDPAARQKLAVGLRAALAQSKMGRVGQTGREL